MKASSGTTSITATSGWSKSGFCKGQVSSGEILLAYFLFFIALTFAITMWAGELNQMRMNNRFSDFEDTASDIAEKLVRTQGIPSDWDEDNVETIGLASEPRVLSTAKIISFLELMNDSKSSTKPGCIGESNYNCSKHLLGVGKYDFYLTIEDLNGSVISVNNITAVAGRYPIDKTDELTLTRPSIVDNKIVQLKLTLWYSEKGGT